MVQTKEQKLAKRREWYRNRADKERERKRIYREKNKLILCEKTKIWCENNKDRRRATDLIYRARLRHKKNMIPVFIDIRV